MTTSDKGFIAIKGFPTHHRTRAKVCQVLMSQREGHAVTMNAVYLEALDLGLEVMEALERDEQALRDHHRHQLPLPFPPPDGDHASLTHSPLSTTEGAPNAVEQFAPVPLPSRQARQLSQPTSKETTR